MQWVHIVMVSPTLRGASDLLRQFITITDHEPDDVDLALCTFDDVLLSEPEVFVGRLTAIVLAQMKNICRSLGRGMLLHSGYVFESGWLTIAPQQVSSR